MGSPSRRRAQFTRGEMSSQKAVTAAPVTQAVRHAAAVSSRRCSPVIPTM